MKTIVVLGIVLALTLVGCLQYYQDGIGEPPATPTIQVQEPRFKPLHRGGRNRVMSRRIKEFSNYEISDYVLVEDNKIPLIKGGHFLSWTMKRTQDSNLAFLFMVIRFYDWVLQRMEVDGVKTLRNCG